MRVLTWDGIRTIVIQKKLDAVQLELPRATGPSEQHVLVSNGIVEVIRKGVAVAPRFRATNSLIADECSLRGAIVLAYR